MEELKQTIVISEMSYIVAECYCPHCDKEKSFIWDTTLPTLLVECPGCLKIYRVSRK